MQEFERLRALYLRDGCTKEQLQRFCDLGLLSREALKQIEEEKNGQFQQNQ